MASSVNPAAGLFDLAGQSIVITGGGYGLGKAMALGLGQARVKLTIAGRTESKLQDTVAEICDAGGEAVYCVLDAVDRNSCDGLVDVAVGHYGEINSAVINHGVIEVATPEDTSEDQWHRVINTNLTGAFYCAQAIGKQMINQGKGGSVVLTSSNGSLVAFEGLTAYGASKAGVDMMCRQMAAEWGQYNIRVNTINPGYTSTPLGGIY
jgi:NAD(P)-dependent dehydrogenase (short-subunit alcohol dehydrogenase family)